MCSIPIVDLGFNNNSPSCEEDIAVNIDNALTEYGFVYLKNHGINENTVNNIFKESKSFFNLDQNSKFLCSNLIDKWKLFGYDGMDPKLKRGNTHRESFNFPPIIPSEIQIPTFSATLVNSIQNLTIEAQPLINRLLRVLAKSLHLENQNYFIERCKGLYDSSVDNITRIKSNFYPYAVGQDVGTEKLTQHFDTDLITLLWRDGKNGLQIVDKNGEWMDAESIPGTILVNTGSILTHWSNGRYPSTVHRVVLTKEEVENCWFRQSLAYFIIPDENVQLSPIGSKNQSSLTVFEYMKAELEKVYKN